MAAIATIVPLALNAIAVLAPIARSLVLHLENVFGKGAGATKLATGAQMLSVAADQMAKAGTISSLPAAEQLAALLQGTVDDLKSRGLLSGPAPVTGIANQPIAAETAIKTPSFADLLVVIGQALQRESA